MQFNIVRAAAGAASFAVLASVAVTGAAPAAADETRTNRVLVVLADFEDQHHAEAGTDKAGIAQRYFGAEGSLQSYYRAVSRGRLSYVPAVPDKVVGPLTLPWHANCDPRAARQEVERQLPQRGLTKGKDYDSLSIVLPRVPCAWAGLAQVGGPVSWLKAGKGGPTLAAVAHEFGHNLGLPHQPRRVCAGGDLGACGAPAEMGRKSPMGGGGAALGLSATQLIHAGWLAPGEHQRVTASGSFTLRPLYGDEKGVRALEVPLGHDRLVLEYRRPAGSLDGRLKGVYAYRVSGDSYRSANPLSTSAGDRDGAVTTLHDTAAKLTVTVGALDADKATVTITVNGVTAPTGTTTAPAVVVPPGNPTASAPASPVPDPDGQDEPADTDDPTGPDDPTASAQAPQASQTTEATEATAHATPAPTAGRSGDTGAGAGADANLAHTGGNGTALALTAAAGATLTAAGALLFRRRNRGGGRRARTQR
ncbi:LPXTG cell wall anchor domain-containing protein [Kitasatospora sp. NPDC056181]|uniref:LPXTG cell wall anchor domain-containing protein n=1 Tax=Kitasatospora sp. NPDC056181 TaxID=3345737 RepID=UPI0035E2E108